MMPEDVRKLALKLALKHALSGSVDTKPSDVLIIAAAYADFMLNNKKPPEGEIA